VTVDCVTILLRILCVLLHSSLFWLFVTTVYLLLSLTCLPIRPSVALSPSACSYVPHCIHYKTVRFTPQSVIKCRFLNEGPERVERYKSIVSLTSTPHLQERNPVPCVQETGWGLRASLDRCGIPFPDCPACSQSLYRLRYPCPLHL